MIKLPVAVTSLAWTQKFQFETPPRARALH